MSTTDPENSASPKPCPVVTWRYQLMPNGDFNTVAVNDNLTPDLDTYWLPAVSNGERRKKEDIVGSKWVLADKDPPENVWNRTLGKETSPGALDAWRAEELAFLQSYEPRLTLIVDSGRGYQYGHELDHMVPVQAIEALRYALKETTDADNCWDAAHVFRLWGTRNNKTGRMAQIVRYEPERVYSPKSLPTVAPPVRAEVECTAEINSEADLDSYLDETEDALVRYVIAHDKKPPHETKQFPSRSEALYFVVNELVRKKVPEGVILATLLRSNSFKEEEAGVCHSVYWWKHKGRLQRRRNPERYAREQVGAALGNEALKASAANSNEKFFNEDGSLPTPANEDRPHLNVQPLFPIPDNLPPRPWHIPGWTLDGSPTIVSGAPGCGKSNLLMHKAVATATGRAILFFEPRGGPRKVLILNCEDRREELQLRAWAVCKEFGIPLDDPTLAENFHIIDITRLELAAMMPKDDKGGQLVMKPTPAFSEFAALVRDGGFRMVILDPAISFHGLNEDKAPDMNLFAGLLIKIAALINGPVVIAQHNRKGGSADNDKQSSIRGSTALPGAVRVAWMMEPATAELANEYGTSPESIVRVLDVKQNYAARTGGYVLEFHQHEHPNGDTASVFRIADKAKPNAQLDDPDYVKELLDFIEEGIGGRPWSTAVSGSTVHRLDHGIKDDKRFSDTTKEAAQKTIMELARRKFIKSMEWRDEARKWKTVWVTTGDNPRWTVREPVELGTLGLEAAE